MKIIIVTELPKCYACGNDGFVTDADMQVRTSWNDGNKDVCARHGRQLGIEHVYATVDQIDEALADATKRKGRKPSAVQKDQAA